VARSMCKLVIEVDFDVVCTKMHKVKAKRRWRSTDTNSRTWK